MSAGNRRSRGTTRAADLAGAEAAMHRAAGDARRRAEEAAEGGARGQSNGKNEEVRNAGIDRDPHKLTFSQAQGYEEIPGPLRLEELPREARTSIWNVFHDSLNAAVIDTHLMDGGWIGGVWREILRAKHSRHNKLPLDEWSPAFRPICKELRHDVETLPFHDVFDLLQFVFRHPKCPPGFVKMMTDVFTECGLAYRIDEGNYPTIVPAVTKEEGNNLVGSLETLREAGLGGSVEHLRKACECINGRDWAGSVRESVHTVESVARMLAPEATTLKPALLAIENQGTLHHVLKDAFIKLYGYASDEKGVRHPLLDGDKAKVGMDEAVFMLAACASFASYLWRKHEPD